MKGFDPKQPIEARPDNSFEPGGLVVTYNNERILLINEGSPWFDESKEPKGLRKKVWDFINDNGGYHNVVTPEPMPMPNQPEQPELAPFPADPDIISADEFLAIILGVTEFYEVHGGANIPIFRRSQAEQVLASGDLSKVALQRQTD